MKSLMYLISILVSFFFLLFLGIISGGLIFSFMGETGMLAGVTAGAVLGICEWFKLVGLIIEREDIYLSRKRSNKFAARTEQSDTSASFPAKDARLGNHMMIGGIIIFLSSSFEFSGLNLLLRLLGVGIVVMGFLISITAYEIPSEEGILKRIKLLLTALRS